MPDSKLFVLDADVFIAAHRSYYAFDIAPGFWSGLLQHAASGEVLSIAQVLNDLKKGYDPKNPEDYDLLAQWAISEFHPYFTKTDEPEVTEIYADMINWVFTNSSFPLAAKNEFADISDSWLIAYAKAKNAVLATNENKIKRTSKVPIPAICRQFGVEYINTFEMLRQLNIKLFSV
jgi:uncharacterized protein YozE (UPF0346 family)